MQWLLLLLLLNMLLLLAMRRHPLHHLNRHSILHHDRMTGSHHLRWKLLPLLWHESGITGLVMRPLLGMHVGWMVMHGMHARWWWLLLLVWLMHERSITGIRDVVQNVRFQSLEVIVTEKTMFSHLTGWNGSELLIDRLVVWTTIRSFRVRRLLLPNLMMLCRNTCRLIRWWWWK